MDPDANYAEQQRIRARLRSGKAMAGDSARLADLREALAHWVSRGGAHPKAWSTRMAKRGA